MLSRPLALASRSPRRREMLAWLGLRFECLDGFIDETPRDKEDPLAHVRRVAEEKALAAAKQLEGGWMVVSADTIVVESGDILGKPVDDENAARMLERLSGRIHSVATALIIYNLPERRLTKLLCESQVCMRKLTSEEILDYVRSGDPLDKAGAYAIQNCDFNPVPEFTGCMANVMGLPLCHLKRELNRQETVINKNMIEICRDNLKYDCNVSERILVGENIG